MGNYQRSNQEAIVEKNLKYQIALGKIDAASMLDEFDFLLDDLTELLQ